jgi:hypothetical protein
LSKVTEGSIDDAVTLDEEMILAEKEYAEAEWAERVLFSAVMSMNDKKPALEQEVRLQQSGYYADHSIPKEVKEVTDSQTRAEVTKKLASSKGLQRRSR